MTSETTTATTPGSGRTGLGHGDAGRGVAIARLVIGLIQGVVLWSLVRTDETNAWPSTVPELFGPLCLVAILVPVVLLAGVGRLRIRTLVVWGVVAALLTALLAFHDVHRASRLSAGLFGGAIFLPFTAATLFILHHLIVPADRERRWIAPYHAYFDAAWMAGVQLALSVGFTGAFWLLLGLGAALFHVIGVSALGDTITKAWFALPVTGLVFATAVQLSDVRPGLIRGVRTIALMLLSWLLLLLTVLVGAFLAALPFTGLEGLWRTGSATALVLATAGAVVILINAAYQDGQADNLPPLALRIAVRVAAVLLYPLIAIAFWGLSLRIGQHGLTPDRIIALACAVVGLAYAIGYGLAALVPLFRRGSPWMKALEPTNIVVAVLAVGVVLALFTPLADPARLSVADQVRRLEADKVSAEAFDYQFLASGSGKAGQKALDLLKRSADHEIARRAASARTDIRTGDFSDEDRLAATIKIEMLPKGASSPFGPSGPSSEAMKNCTGRDGGCVARMMDLDNDGRPEGLIAYRFGILVFQSTAAGEWRERGVYLTTCHQGTSDARELLRKPLSTQPAPWSALNIPGVGVRQISPSEVCDPHEATPR